MQKDYILEVESSESRYPSTIYQREDNLEKTQNDTLIPKISRGKEKYIRFTVKKRYPSTILNVNTLGKLLLGLVLTIILFHTLSEVDPGRKIAVGVYRYICGDDSNIQNLDDQQQQSFIRSVFLSLGKVGLVNAGAARSGMLRLLDLAYFMLSAKITEWLSWQLDSDIEESLLIVPNLGVQCDSVILKKSLGKLLFRCLLAVVRLIVEKACMAVSACQNRIKGNNDGDRNRLRVQRKQMSRLDRLDESLRGSERLILSRQFVPMEYVKDLIINEGFVGFRVLYYLALITVDNTGDGNEVQTSGLNPEKNKSLGYGDFRHGKMYHHGQGSALAGALKSSLDSSSAGATSGLGKNKGKRLKMILVFPHLLPRRKLLETVWRRSRTFLH